MTNLNQKIAEKIQEFNEKFGTLGTSDVRRDQDIEQLLADFEAFLQFSLREIAKDTVEAIGLDKTKHEDYPMECPCFNEAISEQAKKAEQYLGQSIEVLGRGKSEDGADSISVKVNT